MVFNHNLVFFNEADWVVVSLYLYFRVFLAGVVKYSRSAAWYLSVVGDLCETGECGYELIHDPTELRPSLAYGPFHIILLVFSRWRLFYKPEVAVVGRDHASFAFLEVQFFQMYSLCESWVLSASKICCYEWGSLNFSPGCFPPLPARRIWRVGFLNPLNNIQERSLYAGNRKCI